MYLHQNDSSFDLLGDILMTRLYLCLFMIILSLLLYAGPTAVAYADTTAPVPSPPTLGESDWRLGRKVSLGLSGTSFPILGTFREQDSRNTSRSDRPADQSPDELLRKSVPAFSTKRPMQEDWL